MGGVRVPFLRPSQLKPSNHLKSEKDVIWIQKWKHTFTSIRGDWLIFKSQLTHLCFWMSFTPFFRFPSLSDGLSLSTQKSWLRDLFWRSKQRIWTQPLPAELLDEVGSVFGDLLGELNHVDASQDDVVGFHWIWTWERRAADTGRCCRTLNYTGIDSTGLCWSSFVYPHLPVSSSYIRMPRDQ